MPSLTDAFARLERADEHLKGVHELAQKICTAQEKATIVNFEPGKTLMPGEIGKIFSVESANTPISNRLSLLVGDTVNSLRSCLDYLVGELSELDSGVRNQRTQFPAADSSIRFQGLIRTFLNGLNAPHVAYIETLQPYNGTTWTAMLVRLSNLDKHNKLVLVVHDYLIGGTLKTNVAPEEGSAHLHLQMTLQASLRIQLEDGIQLVESLDKIREGVSTTLQYFLHEFVTT